MLWTLRLGSVSSISMDPLFKVLAMIMDALPIMARQSKKILHKSIYLPFQPIYVVK
jgi:hypothetical protein